jgi:hypothetical protein
MGLGEVSINMDSGQQSGAIIGEREGGKEFYRYL